MNPGRGVALSYTPTVGRQRKGGVDKGRRAHHWLALATRLGGTREGVSR